jgi:hypothetical protein
VLTEIEGSSVDSAVTCGQREREKPRGKREQKGAAIITTVTVFNVKDPK